MLKIAAGPYLALLIGLAVLLQGCGALTFSPWSARPTSLVSRENTTPHIAQHVYWTLTGRLSQPAIQYTKTPLEEFSLVKTVDGSTSNGLYAAKGIAFDPHDDRLWVLVWGKSGYDPSEAEDFALPLTPDSLPVHKFVLSGTDYPSYIAFDAAGHLWVNSRYNNTVLEYSGPFHRNGTLLPNTKLKQGLNQPNGIAFDTQGNLYVANFGSTGTHSIAVFKAPVTSNRKPYFLNGLIYPGGLAFDENGNLYGSTNGPSYSATVRYDSNDLKGGSDPSIVDRMGLVHSYGASFALSASGELYFSNCGVGASVIVYPTNKKPFSSNLTPRLEYSNYKISYDGCVWGLVIH